MANQFTNNKKVKLVAGAIADAMDYTKASVSKMSQSEFNGKKFVPAGTDGAWWLNPDLRNYKRTVSNRKVADGIEQVDLMPDGTYRRSVWKGAKTLDDLRKKPDEVKVMYNIKH